MRLLSLIFCTRLAFAAAAPTAPALVYSTYLRDNFTPNAIATDAAGNIYMAGTILIDPAANQTTALVVKLNPQGTQYLYSRYLGGSIGDGASAIAVDSAGNAYVAGATDSPDFPVTAGGNLGGPPRAPGHVASGPTSFVTKLDPNGNVVFSDLLGGKSFSDAEAVAVTAAGQVIVSGLSWTSGFPTTPGAYSIADSGGHPFLLELDPTGAKLVFSATGIGGSAIALDSGGNIYVAGTTGGVVLGPNVIDYPTTPGAYQSTFPTGMTCLIPCQVADQYVTKVDPTGSKLIYSTSLSGPGNTYNAGLAVDQAGNAYVTGFSGVGYPYTVTPPSIPPLPGPSRDNYAVFPFLSKLDAAGQNLLFSVPVGAAGVQVDSAGAVYVGGRVGYTPGFGGSLAVTASVPALSGVPTACLPNNGLIQNSAYVSKADAASGNIFGTQFIGGSNVNPAAVALAGSTLWITGTTNLPDVPFTPNALTWDLSYASDATLGVGAYLGGVDFSQPQPAAGTPQIGCLLDAADFSPVGPATRYQVLALFGTGLGPAVGVTATDYATTSLAGVGITVAGAPAILLYVSSTQINFAVPQGGLPQFWDIMQVTVNGLSALQRGLPPANGTPHLFMNGGSLAFALNADGSINTGTNPAKPGSTISVFVNGLVRYTFLNSDVPQIDATGGWRVLDVNFANPFILRVDLQVPKVSCGSGNGPTPPPCGVTLPLSAGALAIETQVLPSVVVSQ